MLDPAPGDPGIDWCSIPHQDEERANWHPWLPCFGSYAGPARCQGRTSSSRNTCTRRLYRMRDRCAVLRTLLQCVCTQRRNCIGQLSPFSEYAPTALRNKWKPAATIKLIHYRRLGAKPHESSASDGYLGIQCLQRFQSPRFDAQLGLQIPGAASRAPPSGVSRRASPCPSEVTRPSNSPPKSSPCWALPHSSPLHPH